MKRSAGDVESDTKAIKIESTLDKASLINIQLRAAVIAKDSARVTSLLAQGADPDNKSLHTGKTSLHCLANFFPLNTANVKHALNILDLFLKEKIKPNINATDNKSRTILDLLESKQAKLKSQRLTPIIDKLKSNGAKTGAEVLGK